jgi:coproporphyrinogen III oxidase
MLSHFSAYSDNVLPYMLEFQDRLTRTLEAVDGQTKFKEDNWSCPATNIMKSCLDMGIPPC